MGSLLLDAGPFEESLDLSGVSAPSDARRFVRRQVLAEELREALELLVSDLVTNAISYTFGNVQMNISDDGQQIRVEVSDGSTMSQIIRERAGT